MNYLFPYKLQYIEVIYQQVGNNTHDSVTFQILNLFLALLLSSFAGQASPSSAQGNKKNRIFTRLRKVVIASRFIRRIKSKVRWPQNSVSPTEEVVESKYAQNQGLSIYLWIVSPNTRHIGSVFRPSAVKKLTIVKFHRIVSVMTNKTNSSPDVPGTLTSQFN